MVVFVSRGACTRCGAADELHLHAGDELEVLERNDDGWFKGRVIATGAEGMFPSNYITEN